MIALDNIAREIHHGDNINRVDGIQRNYYNRARRIDVEEVSNTLLTGFQFSISGLVDERDRIHNREGIPQPFFVESVSKTWTRGNVIALGRTNFVQYMGNPTATPISSEIDTFDFAGNFVGTAIDTTRWIITAATGWSVGGGELRGTNTSGRLTSVPVFSAPIVQEVRTRNIIVSHHTASGFWLSTSNGITLMIHGPPWNDVIFNDAAQIQIGAVANMLNVPLLITFTAIGTTVTITVDRLDTGVRTYTGSFTNTVLNERIMLGMRADNLGGGQAYDAFWRSVHIRKHASPEPMVIVRQEVALT